MTLPENAHEIAATQVPRALRGYDRAAVDELLARLTGTIAQLEQDAARERDRREQVEHQLAEAGAARAALEQQLREALAEAEPLAQAVVEASRERDEVAAVLEEMRGEREERVAYTDRLEHELGRFRELERSLTQAVVAAEQTGNELRAHAERETALVLEKARTDARRIVLDASAERERLLGELRTIRAMLQSALAALDDGRLLSQPDPGAPGDSGL